MANEISAQYSKALDLHKRISVAAQLVQQNLWDMCTGLKEMRDGKLYKELGYQNFEEYCGTEFNMNRRNAYRYISIIENVNSENVTSMSHYGMTKLYLLSTLSEPEQEKITAENDVERMTVKELEQQIKELKSDNKILNLSNNNLHDRLDDAVADRKKLIDQKTQLAKRITELQNEITELESRPIEVAVAEPSDDVRQLKDTLRALERSTEEQIERMENDHVADIRKLHEQNRAETERQLKEQKAEYEEKLRAAQSNAQSPALSERQAFKAYYAAAFDAFGRMIDFAVTSTENKEFFRGKIEALIEAFTASSKNM